MTDSIQVSITGEPIDCGALVRNHGASHHGAQVSFFGIVRDVNFGRQVIGIEYDAFAPLAETTFREFSQEALARWGEDVRISISHRVGALQVGDISVALIVSTRHRSEAYAVSRYLIEELKHRSPIWKKEHYSDGSSDWVQGHALCQHDHEEPVHEHEHLQSQGTGARL